MRKSTKMNVYEFRDKTWVGDTTDQPVLWVAARTKEAACAAVDDEWEFVCNTQMIYPDEVDEDTGVDLVVPDVWQIHILDPDRVAEAQNVPSNSDLFSTVRPIPGGVLVEGEDAFVEFTGNLQDAGIKFECQPTAGWMNLATR